MDLLAKAENEQTLPRACGLYINERLPNISISSESTHGCHHLFPLTPPPVARKIGSSRRANPRRRIDWGLYGVLYRSDPILAALIVRSARVGGEDVSAATPSPSRRIALALLSSLGQAGRAKVSAFSVLAVLAVLAKIHPSLASWQPSHWPSGRSSMAAVNRANHTRRDHHGGLWDLYGDALPPFAEPAIRTPHYGMAQVEHQSPARPIALPPRPPKCLSETPQLRPCLFLMATGPFRLGRYCSGSPWPFSCSCLSHLTQSSQIATTLSQRRPSPRNIENSDIG